MRICICFVFWCLWLFFSQGCKDFAWFICSGYLSWNPLFIIIQSINQINQLFNHHSIIIQCTSDWLFQQTICTSCCLFHSLHWCIHFYYWSNFWWIFVRWATRGFNVAKICRHRSRSFPVTVFTLIRHSLHNLPYQFTMLNHFSKQVVVERIHEEMRHVSRLIDNCDSSFTNLFIRVRIVNRHQKKWSNKSMKRKLKQTMYSHSRLCGL